MKFSFLLMALLICSTGAFAQVFITKTGFAGFYSKTAFEDIKAENNQVYAVIDAGKKNLAFSMLLKGFIFTKELMQEHFNENYVESDKYPKASFTGQFTGDLATDKDGSYPVTVKGNLSLHNTSRPVEIKAVLQVKGGHLLGSAEFNISPEDYNISIPAIVRDKINKELRVHITFDANPTK